MNWKKLISTAIIAGAGVSLMSNCSKWTEPEPSKIFDHGTTETDKPESYYKALRDWKASKHSVSFGWFSGWGEPSTTTSNMLMGIPDSMDIVSLWSNWTNLSEGKIHDLKRVQQLKGLRVVPCTFTSHIGQGITPPEYDQTEASRNEFWGWNKDRKEAVRKYARALVDTIFKYGYDGLDIDYEPTYYPGPLVQDKECMIVLIEELGKHIGPESSNPDKLFILDGEPIWAEVVKHFSYIVSQAYATTGVPTEETFNSMGGLDRILDGYLNRYKDFLSEEEITNRVIVTENLEAVDYALKGGYKFYGRDQILMEGVPSLVGFAMWEPKNGFRKGGFGAYQFGYEATNTPSYKWMRRAIQVQNPSYN